MARNEEKAQSMLNRWLVYKQELAGGPKVYKKRPALSADCDNVPDCERFRMQIVKEIGRKIMEIQNESLGEQRLRDLNDNINKLLREKAHWERRIIELGGPNYRKYERIADDALVAEQFPVQGNEQKGYIYKYFGAAKNLPGVKQSESKEPQTKKLRSDYKGIDAEYFGYEDDSDLIEMEAKLEKEAVAKSVAAWEKEQITKGQIETPGNTDSLVIPTRQQMEVLLVDRRKQDLLKRYVSEDLMDDLSKQKEEVEVVLGKRKK